MGEKINLWEDVGNKCLERAKELLNDKKSLTEENSKIIYNLVSSAMAIDSLNLQWEMRNRYGERVLRGQP